MFFYSYACFSKVFLFEIKNRNNLFYLKDFIVDKFSFTIPHLATVFAEDLIDSFVGICCNFPIFFLKYHIQLQYCFTTIST